MKLSELIPLYAETKDLEPGTVGYYQRTVSVFNRWHGKPVDVEELTDSLVNRFLAHLREQENTSHYRKSLQIGICALWKFATKRGLVPAPEDVAKIRVKRKPVHTWSTAEVARLKSEARRTLGVFRTNLIPRGQYFATIITAAWYTGLSQVDLHKLKLSHFKDGKLTWTRTKTGAWAAMQIPADEWAEILRYAEISVLGDQELWPRFTCDEGFRSTFRKIRDAAGLNGPFKTLRASAGTAFEIAHPGFGHRFLGNTRDVFMRNYYDPRREDNDLPQAPSLRGEEGAQ